MLIRTLCGEDTVPPSALGRSTATSQFNDFGVAWTVIRQIGDFLAFAAAAQEWLAVQNFTQG